MQSNVIIRIDAAKKAHWQSLALDAGMSLSDWIRSRCDSVYTDKSVVYTNIPAVPTNVYTNEANITKPDKVVYTKSPITNPTVYTRKHHVACTCLSCKPPKK